METINWVQPKMFGRQYLFGAKDTRKASFKFVGTWSNDAIYTSDTASYFFKKQNSLKNKIRVLEHGAVIADVDMAGWGKPSLRLPSGRVYTLISDSFSSNCRWVSEGEVVASYSQGMFSSDRGSINVSGKMLLEDKELLISTGFFLKQQSSHTAAFFVILMILYIVIL